MNETSCLLIFVKYPEKGKVKSRLARHIGQEAALNLYRNFVLDLLQTVRGTAHPFRICYDPPEAREEMMSWLGRDYLYMPQRGCDLGEKMKNALSDVFTSGFSKAVLIGSDIPDLTTEVINEAFEALEAQDAVLGPAFDGGYYLIGFRKMTFLPDIFTGIPWGTDRVFRQTVDILEGFKRTIHTLSEWRDVDTMDDLRDLFARNKDGDFRRSGTISYILQKRIMDIS